jgi:hypothetical protein
MTPEMIGLSLAIIASGSALITLGIRTCLKSNCTDVNLCWGCVVYKRETADDVAELEIQPVSTKI